MTAPIEVAYQAFTDAMAAALVAATFIPATAAFEVDPVSTFAPSGVEETLVTAAAALKGPTRTVGAFIGSGAARYVVEREVTLELAAAGPEAATTRTDTISAAVAALAIAAASNPTLSGNTERCELVERADDALPPNGDKVFLTFTLRVRSNDALGMS